MSKLDVFGCLLLFGILSVQPAHAYLDAGTGSYVLQAVTAALFSSMWMVKKWVSKLKR